MTSTGAEVSETLIDRVEKWLEQSALDGADIKTIVSGTCERLTASGVPLARVHMSFSMLHPLYDAIGFTWLRGKGMTVEGIQQPRGEEKPERFLKSPYYYLLSNQLEHVRRRIDPDQPSEFPIFDDLKEIGITDYLGFVQSFGESAGRGMVGSWATDRPGGFPEDMIEALLRIQRSLAVTAKMALLGKLATNMLNTYLGQSAGARVLSGQTRRGDVDTIRAVLVMADMRDSSALAEQAGRETYTETLNQFFEAIAAPFNDDGGEILSFIGDGVLAVYPCERHSEPSQIAARAALAAAQVACNRMEDLNARRQAEGLPPIGFGIALHLGNVMFGNVGLTKRLTFSAFGAAVNEVERLEKLTKRYGVPIVASEHFMNYCGGEWVLRGEERLAGFAETVSIFTPQLAAEATVALAAAEAEAAPRSEAEQVMLLFRNRGRPESTPFDRRAS